MAGIFAHRPCTALFLGEGTSQLLRRRRRRAGSPPAGHRRGVAPRHRDRADPDAQRFVCEQSFRDRAQVATLEAGFAAAVGYRLGTVGFKLRTDLSKNRIPSVRLAGGWQAATHVDGVPEHLLDEVGAIQGLVDEEAPSGEIECQAHAVTPDEYRSDLQAVLDEGCHLVEAIALAPDGRVAGWTGLKTAPNDRRSAQVLGTMVLEEFRGHGLGMALKSAVATRALGVGVTTLSTESNEDNRWKLDINGRQGFERIGVTAAFLRAAS